MEKVRIFIAGDSTASNYDQSKFPRAGWGQVIGSLLTKEVSIHNHASSGRSSKSFVEEGRLEKISTKLEKGDFFFIQFGHNDSKQDEKRYTDPFTSYKEYLRLYIEEARQKGANPILLTPIERRGFHSDGSLVETHGYYPTAMRELAKEYHVPLIDITKKSKTLFEKLGPEKTKEIFLWIKQGEHVNYQEGVKDNTHLSEYGAKHIARLVLEGCKEKQILIANYMIE
ncbi:rhamnogalacturonan acetylesterase [Halalkalibacter krulwichiae]|uniref:Rhamnogalacturonan acetylesterase RhgT n=1 Tax=Halalkalibacter krulwichiae TaxID=199441 RepID=A0A1X9MGG6_9BACI|nr:rhamnogalacturonan acetylesterase [Halalkalibacter krulwichiae]ARK29532.1 Rhamnogalacturonan acetylesterase RhgT [Halalkalibacter krulwichiae]